MYVLYAENTSVLNERSHLFEQYMEPLLRRLESANQAGLLPPSLPEFRQYLQVCRWPFRKLEYSFALDILLEHLQPGDRYLDAGSGVTPLAQVMAGCGVCAEACDGNGRLINELRHFGPEQIYGIQVMYGTQDLTAMSYPDETFDAISCISVLEHIPAPFDQKAVRELLRILKPGGLLVLTVDFQPPMADGRSSRLWHYIKRAIELARSGNLNEIGQGLTRKIRAQQAVRQGAARRPRSSNQCFEIEHLEQDILPLLQGNEIESHLLFSRNLTSLTPAHARRFWDLEAGLYDNQGRRAVLPAAYTLRKVDDAVLV
jgi:2-polyprenyl-3-methyl-5-hydroxy-6-metoxy-1,4-benzoquinol methylase